MYLTMIRLFVVLLCLLPALVSAETSRSIHVEWGYTPPSQPVLAGFKLYQEGTLVCQSNDAAATAMNCTVTLASDTTTFTLTAIFADGSESPHSSPFAFSSVDDTETAGSTSPSALLATSTTVGSAPLTVSFDGSASSGADSNAIVSYLWSFGDGGSATGATSSHTFTSAGTYTTTLTVTDSKGLTSVASTPIVVSGSTTGSPATPTANTTTDAVPSTTAETTAPLHLEAGEVSVGSTWVRVPLNASFTNPIVVAGPPRFQDSDPCVIRLRNVSASGFDIRLTEWPYQDGVHAQEVISFLVLEKGRTRLDDGTVVEAGSFSGTTDKRYVPFAAWFGTVPVVLTSVTSTNEATTVAGRAYAVGRVGFGYVLSEQKNSAEPSHAAETVHYVAWEPGKGTLGPIRYEVASTSLAVTSSWTENALSSAFTTPPLLLADMQTLVSADPAALRLREVTGHTFQLKVEEEQSLNQDVTHPGERVGYLALASLEAQRLATLTWEFDSREETTISGFRMLVNGQVVCATDDVTARQLVCEIPLATTATAFAVQAVEESGETGSPSNTLVYRP